MLPPPASPSSTDLNRPLSTNQRPATIDWHIIRDSNGRTALLVTNIFLIHMVALFWTSDPGRKDYIHTRLFAPETLVVRSDWRYEIALERSLTTKLLLRTWRRLLQARVKGWHGGQPPQIYQYL
jgi:hypothetical protein